LARRETQVVRYPEKTTDSKAKKIV